MAGQQGRHVSRHVNTHPYDLNGYALKDGTDWTWYVCGILDYSAGPFRPTNGVGLHHPSGLFLRLVTSA